MDSMIPGEASSCLPHLSSQKASSSKVHLSLEFALQRNMMSLLNSLFLHNFSFKFIPLEVLEYRDDSNGLAGVFVIDMLEAAGGFVVAAAPILEAAGLEFQK